MSALTKRLRQLLGFAVVAAVTTAIGLSATAGVAGATPAGFVVAAPAVVSPAAACPTVYWGSLPKSVAGSTVAPITGVRTGQHPCFDRIVVDLGAGAGSIGYSVRYVPTVYQDASGLPVPLRGGAYLEVVVRAPAYNVTTGTPTYHPANPAELAAVWGYATLRQVAFAGSFEGQTTIGVGVRARLPFQVFVLNGPGSGHRLVIDIAHHW